MPDRFCVEQTIVLTVLWYSVVEGLDEAVPAMFQICDVESACICVFVTVRHALCDSSLSYLCLSRGNLVPAEKRFERVTCLCRLRRVVLLMCLSR